MKALVQRVSEASVAVDGRTIGRIGRGLLVLFCAEAGDTDGEADGLARKVARLRIFEDAAGKMNRALPEVGGGALVVSQFTLCADTRRGNRPSTVQRDYRPHWIACPVPSATRRCEGDAGASSMRRQRYPRGRDKRRSRAALRGPWPSPAHPLLIAPASRRRTRLARNLGGPSNGVENSTGQY